MFKVSFVLAMSAVVLVGCQSTHKLPKAKGKWTAVNAVGFIPPNTTKYTDKVETLTQNIDVSKTDSKTDSQKQGENP